ncbi:MAG: hypothetical protein JWN69_76 [Alphaproteobacteria bacterium]|nr:hypothetical protein [Alphaproteobacteria bacterium]
MGYCLSVSGIDDMTDKHELPPGPAGEPGLRERALPARQRRLSVNTIVTLYTGSGGVEANLCDVSENGIKIESDTPITQGPVKVKMIGFPIFSGDVRWHGGRRFGIRFDNPIPEDFLIEWMKVHGRG